MNKCLFLTFFISAHLFVNAQISGNVTADGVSISGVRVQVKDAEQVVAYHFTGADGSFFFPLTGENLTLEASHLNFEQTKFTINSTPAVDLELILKKRAEPLDEIVIKNMRAARQKKDTVVYNPDSFKDGSERVVEDLLKKLPGISVADNGKIYFKGKEIEALMIDGDDLFLSRYTVGSKNLDVNAVEAVEAIENFNKNKVLHKLTESDRVAINLRLKSNQPVVTSRAVLMNDFHMNYDNSVTALLLDKKYKGFGAIGINNVGRAESVSEELRDQDDLRYSQSRVTSIIQQGAFPQLNGRSLLNRTITADEALKIRLSKQTSSLFNAQFLSDRVIQDINASTSYQIAEEELLYKNSDRQVRKPKVVRFSNDTDYYNDKDFQLNSHITFASERSDFVDRALIANMPVNSDAHSERTTINSKIEGTYQLSDDSAFKLIAYMAHNNLKEKLRIFPAISIDSVLQANGQSGNINNTFVATQFQYYLNWKNCEIKVSNTFDVQGVKFKSLLSLEDAEGFYNDFKFNSVSNLFKTQFVARFKRFKFTAFPSLRFSEISHRGNFSQINLLLGANLKYSWRKKHTLHFVVDQFIETPNVDQIFDQPILTSYRTAKQNSGHVANISTTDASLIYSFSDFYNTFFLKAGLGYTYKDSDYYNVTTVSPIVIYNRAVLLNFSNDRLNAHLSLHKFVPLIKINVKLNTSFSRFKFYNYLEGSPVRLVRNHLLSNEVYLYTAFKKGFNIHNKTQVEINSFSGGRTTNYFTQIQNEFKAIYKIFDKFLLQGSVQTYIPRVADSKQYNFLDFQASYIFESWDCEVYFKGRNLLNHQAFRSVNVSDYAVSSFSYRLQERSLLLGLRLKLF